MIESRGINNDVGDGQERADRDLLETLNLLVNIK
jgi:hypothetical protein